MIKCNEKYGCLSVLDEGEEYLHTELYKELQEKARLLQEKIKPCGAQVKDQGRNQGYCFGSVN